MNDKIAIIFWEDYLSIAPTIISLAKGFTDKNYIVDIYTSSLNPRYPPINFNDGNINIIQLKKPKNESGEKVFNKWINLVFSNPNKSLKVYDFLKIIYKLFQEIRSIKDRRQFISRYSEIINPTNYKQCIVTDMTGLSLIKNTNKFPKNFLIYLSLEIEYSKLLSRFFNPYKYFCILNQKKILKSIHHIVIQDDLRKKELVLENGLCNIEHTFYLMPNTVSPAPRIYKSNFLKNKFAINNIVILHIGQISDAAQCLEIAKSLNNQKEFSLVFHDKKFTDFDDPYLKSIRNSTNYNIHFSLTPVEISELDEIILSSKIGILAYSLAYGKNFELITNASGKLIMFLRLGIPIIAMDFFGIKELVDKYKCGIVVDKWEEVIPAAKMIMNNYEFYSDNALNCFLQEFNFNNYFTDFFNSLEAINK